jgi:hypothetical protein
MTSTAMIVMEPGSEWPGQVMECTNVVAFSQGCEDLLRLTQSKLDALARGGQTVRVAVLACGSSIDDGGRAHRAQLARALIGAVARATHGRLILSAGHQGSQELVRGLLTLVEDLTGEVRGTTATISLRLAEGSHPSVRRARLHLAAHGDTGARGEGSR